MSFWYLGAAKPPALDEISLYLFQGYSDLFAPGFGDQAIPGICKPRPVFFQVDENCDLAAFAIGYESDSSHGFIFTRRHLAVLGLVGNRLPSIEKEAVAE
jgi:hypothetical protein